MELTVPKGYRRNSKGGFDPETMIKEIDIARDDLVNEIIVKTKTFSEQMAQLKRDLFADVRAFCELSAEKYGVTFGGGKGNLQLTSYDGRYRVLVAVNETIAFDERLQVAKALVDECIQSWVGESRDEIKVLVADAFYVGKSGKINTTRILGLRRLEIKDPRWIRAMDAISDSILRIDSKEYIRTYERNDEGKYELINLDLTKL